jgi:DNA-binding MarR family transcriptional regulator
MILCANRTIFNMHMMTTEKGDAHELPELVMVLLDEMNYLVKRAATTRLEAHFGISLTELLILRAIYRRPGISHKELLARLWFERTATSKTVSALVRRGLVTRGISSQDARVVCLNLTTEARKIVAQVAVVAEHEVTDFMRSVLGADEIATFAASVQALLDEARRRYRGG